MSGPHLVVLRQPLQSRTQLCLFGSCLSRSCRSVRLCGVSPRRSLRALALAATGGCSGATLAVPWKVLLAGTLSGRWDCSIIVSLKAFDLLLCWDGITVERRVRNGVQEADNQSPCGHHTSVSDRDSWIENAGEGFGRARSACQERSCASPSLPLLESSSSPQERCPPSSFFRPGGSVPRKVGVSAAVPKFGRLLAGSL